MKKCTFTSKHFPICSKEVNNPFLGVSHQIAKETKSNLSYFVDITLICGFSKLFEMKPCFAKTAQTLEGCRGKKSPENQIIIYECITMKLRASISFES